MTIKEEIQKTEGEIQSLQEKLERLKSSDHRPEKGMHFIHLDTGNIYVVANANGRQHLVNIETGTEWTYPSELKNIFNGDAAKFERVVFKDGIISSVIILSSEEI